MEEKWNYFWVGILIVEFLTLVVWAAVNDHTMKKEQIKIATEKCNSNGMEFYKFNCETFWDKMEQECVAVCGYRFYYTPDI